MKIKSTYRMFKHTVLSAFILLSVFKGFSLAKYASSAHMSSCYYSMHKDLNNPIKKITFHETVASYLDYKIVPTPINKVEEIDGELTSINALTGFPLAAKLRVTKR